MTNESMYQIKSSSAQVVAEGSKLILSVDDDLSILYTRYRLLSSAGYGVLSASDGAQALMLFAEHPVDLVVLDYALPEMDGGMVADAMKAHRPDIPIIIVSGVEVPEHILTLVNGYVKKGGNPAGLLTSIQRVLEVPCAHDPCMLA